MNKVWLIATISLLMLVVLVAMRSKKSGRSALYGIAVKMQYAICLAAALLPTLATVIEELPERFLNAWHRERGDPGFEVVRRLKAG
jgi:hypothetical protein